MCIKFCVMEVVYIGQHQQSCNTFSISHIVIYNTFSIFHIVRHCSNYSSLSQVSPEKSYEPLILIFFFSQNINTWWTQIKWLPKSHKKSMVDLVYTLRQFNFRAYEAGSLKSFLFQTSSSMKQGVRPSDKYKHASMCSQGWKGRILKIHWENSKVK